MTNYGISMKKNSTDKIDKSAPDYLTPLLEQTPATWALIRANEIRHLDKVKFGSPILDVGCGDGLVAKIIQSKRNQRFDWGIDLSAQEIEFAKKSGSYKKCKVANVYNLPFKDGSFSTVFSNSVIEHIPNLDLALSEMSRVLKKGGQFVITVPTPYLTSYLIGVIFFKKIGMKSLADLYGKFFNWMFKHHNLFNEKQWGKILSRHNLKLINHTYYHTSGTIKAHEILAYLAIPYGFSKKILNYWLVFPKFRKIFIVPWLKKIIYRYYIEDTKSNEGGSLLLVAQKASDRKNITI